MGNMAAAWHDLGIQSEFYMTGFINYQLRLFLASFFVKPRLFMFSAEALVFEP